ncbi:amidohydrolase [Colletotrichum orchidophilum]|uniref:Amidohydrolase n=1 Tax=Colletotrichum orchidophilum TaxID=1209926 RepID=A0A1G4BNS9_9PEZI|nr:amidohydrolase [Colletotrichum orchidophilum]OHF02963.1 amidohydrolase [Colletotrichum orchidophilum]
MTTSANRIVLKNGVLLIHGDDGKVNPQRSDILIEGDKISEIGQNIETGGDDVKVLDCEGKIISPGFISTHHHVWQTALKGRHVNHTLLEYLPRGNFGGAFYTAEDAFWGELGGALEAIDGGTTTVVDHSSLNMGPEFPPTMIQALVASGLRAVYCYCVPRATSWNPFSTEDDYTSPHVLETWRSIATSGPYGDGRVQLGFVVDNIYQSPDQMKHLYSELRAAHAKVITTHAAAGLAFGNGPSVVQILHSHNLLGSDVLLSHANFPKDGDAELVKKHGVYISTTPNTELQMGWPPVALQPDFEAHSSLGVDCHSCGSGFMPSQMRLGLQYARTERHENLRRLGKWSRHVGPSAEQVFNLATIGGARAIGMAGEVGQIRVGAKADLVVFSTDSPSMLPAAEEDPIAAVVLHSSERDVEAVIVGGVIRKENGKLLPVSVTSEVKGAIDLGLGEQNIAWKDVAKNLVESQKRLNDKAEGIDMKAAEETIMDNFYMNRKDMVEPY